MVKANRFKLAWYLLVDAVLVMFTGQRSCRWSATYMIEIHRENRKWFKTTDEYKKLGK